MGAEDATRIISEPLQYRLWSQGHTRLLTVPVLVPFLHHLQPFLHSLNLLMLLLLSDIETNAFG